MTEKKFGGTIENWHKIEVPIDKKLLKSTYGKNLGYVVRGYLGADPTGRGFGNSPIRTSLVVKFNRTMSTVHKGFDYSIETLNTIYKLGEPLGREPKLGDLR